MDIREEIKKLPLSTLVEIHLKPGTCFIAGTNAAGMFISPEEYEGSKSQTLFRDPALFQLLPDGTRIAGYYAGAIADMDAFNIDMFPARASLNNTRLGTALIRKASAYTVAIEAVNELTSYRPGTLVKQEKTYEPPAFSD